MKTYDVYGIGNALMDTLVNVEDQHLEDIELKKGSMTIVDHSHSDFVNFVLGSTESIKQAGGSVSNTMAGIANLGGKALFAGKVGRDKLGFDYEMMMLRHGVGVDLRKDDGSTGNVIAMITPDAQRTFLVHLGSATRFSKYDVNVQAIKRSKILHLEGYMLEDAGLKKAALYAMAIAKRHGTIVSIDLSDASLIERNIDEFKRIVKKYVDLLFLNEDEALAYTGQKDEKKALLKASKDVKLVVVKLGERGSLMKVRNKILRFRPYPITELVDTTGAGDMYAAGVLYAIANRLPLEDAGKIASYASSKIIQQTGARLDHRLMDQIKFL